MIAYTSGKIAKWMKDQNPEHPVSQNVLAYSVAIVLNVIVTLLLSLTVATITGRFNDVFVFLVMFALLRAISGGYHFQSMSGCIVITTIIANIVPFAADFITFQGILWMNILNVVLSVLFSPSRIKGQTRIPESWFPALKVASIILVSLNFWFESSLLALTFTIQCLALIRIERR